MITEDKIPTSEIIHEMEPKLAKAVLALIYAGEFVEKSKVLHAIKIMKLARTESEHE